MAFAGWWRRRRFACAGLGLYTFLAVAMMAPLASRELPSTPAQDLANHVSGIIEARRALEEGQFPIRVAPDQNLQTRYPVFQFYGNLPYSLGGAAYLVTHADPYRIWKWEVMAFLVLGGFFIYRSARMLTRQPLPSLAAGAVFLTAPYVLTDIHGRYAFSEIVSFMLLPVAFYYSMRCFVTHQLGPILASAITWSALILSHNITFLYAALYFGLFYLSWFKPQRKTVYRGLRVAGGLALGLALTAWSIVPQQYLVPHLCSGLRTDVFKAGWLTPLGVLLAPSVSLPVHLPTIYIGEPEHFGLQIGWPILAAVGLVLWYFRSPLMRIHGRHAVMTRLLLLFTLAFFMTWTPFDFWRGLPAVLDYVQFAYRLLMFVVLWGSLLAAYALVLALDGRMRPMHLAVIIIGLGWTASPFMAPHKTEPHITLAQEIAHPEMGRGGAGAVYALTGSKLAQTSLLHPQFDWADPVSGGLVDITEFNRFGRVFAAFPGPRPGDALRLEGIVSAEVKTTLPLTVKVDGVVVATPQLPPGPFELTLPLPPASDNDRIVVYVEGEPIIQQAPPPHPVPIRHASFTLSHLTLQPATNTSPGSRFLPAETVRPMMQYGHPSTLQIETSEQTLVQLPIIYYPNVLQVKINGTSVPPQNLGRFVAVELPPGRHIVSVQLIGIQWANVFSLVAWIGTAVAGLILGVRRAHHRSRLKRLHQGTSLPKNVDKPLLSARAAA